MPFDLADDAFNGVAFADLDTLTSMIDEGLVTPALDRAWPLADIADAMRALERGTVRGKVAITP